MRSITNSELLVISGGDSAGVPAISSGVPDLSLKACSAGDPYMNAPAPKQAPSPESEAIKPINFVTPKGAVVGIFIEISKAINKAIFTGQ